MSSGQHLSTFSLEALMLPLISKVNEPFVWNKSYIFLILYPINVSESSWWSFCLNSNFYPSIFWSIPLELYSAKQEGGGKAVPILVVKDNDIYELDEQALESIAWKAKGRKLSVLAVAGDFRKGKSFLVSLMCKYLKTNVSRDVIWTSIWGEIHIYIFMCASVYIHLFFSFAVPKQLDRRRRTADRDVPMEKRK